MPKTHKPLTLKEETRDDVIEGNKQHGRYEEQPDFSNPEKELDNNPNLQLEGEQQGDVGPDVVKHPELLETAGLPGPFNPDPDIDPNLEGDPILQSLSKDALRDRNKQQLKKKLDLENKLKNRHTHKYTNRERHTPPKPRPGG